MMTEQLNKENRPYAHWVQITDATTEYADEFWNAVPVIESVIQAQANASGHRLTGEIDWRLTETEGFPEGPIWVVLGVQEVIPLDSEEDAE